MVSMANWWQEQGKKVTLISFDATPSPFPLHDNITRIALDTLPCQKGTIAEWPEESQAVLRLQYALRQTGEGPVVSFLTKMNLRTLLAARGSKRRALVSERAFPPAVPLPTPLETLRTRLYREAHRVVMQTAYARNVWALPFLPHPQIAVIPNASNLPSDQGEPLRHSRPYFLAAGRLDQQKGFDLLLEAFRSVARQYQEIDLIIAGEGEERANLEQQRAALGLANRVLLPGAVENMTSAMRGALAFVLSSRFEGFPNVLTEAMSLGKAVLAFDCRTGPGELIAHGRDGLLVKPEHAETLAKAMLDLYRNPELRAELGKNAGRKMRAFFSQESIMSLWDEAIHSTPP